MERLVIFHNIVRITCYQIDEIDVVNLFLQPAFFFIIIIIIDVTSIQLEVGEYFVQYLKASFLLSSLFYE